MFFCFKEIKQIPSSKELHELNQDRTLSDQTRKFSKGI